MSVLDCSASKTLADILQAQMELVTAAFNHCFETTFELRAEGLRTQAEIADEVELHGPGVIVGLSEGGLHMAVLLPASLPLPDWYRQPSKREQSRLEKLAREWSLHCFPEETPAQGCLQLSVDNLWRVVQQAQPAADAVAVPVQVTGPAGVSPARIYCVWPLSARPQPHVDLPVAEDRPAETPRAIASAQVSAAPAIEQAAVAGVFPQDQPVFDEPQPELASARTVAAPKRDLSRFLRLTRLPVTISVRLAEKKIEVGQLLALTPGAIVTFEKSCEDLLDLYVNNSLYCHGEAVKIGEKFGFKVNEVGVVHERVSKLVQPD